MNKKREEFLSTKGCRTFSTKIDKRLIKFTELGGEEFYDIWKYYFLDVSLKFIFGKIFGKVMKKMLKFTYLDDYLNDSVKNGDELNRVIVLRMNLRRGAIENFKLMGKIFARFGD